MRKRKRESEESKKEQMKLDCETALKIRLLEYERIHSEGDWRLPLSERMEMAKTKKKEERKAKKKIMKQILLEKSVSSAVEEEKEDKVTKVYLSLSTSDCVQSWYGVDLLDPHCCDCKVKDSKNSPLDKTLKFYSPTFTQSILGDLNVASLSLSTKIYTFGGYRNPPTLLTAPPKPGVALGTTNATVYDTLTCQVTRLPNMLSKRVQPKLIYCEDCIFVLGCSRTSTSLLKPWGECFHLSTQSWSPLPLPPRLDTSRFYGAGASTPIYYFQTRVCSSVLLLNPTRILTYMTHSPNKLLCFNLHTWEWSDFPDFTIDSGKFDTRDHDFPSMLLVRSTLYIFFGMSLCYYDFDNPRGLQQVMGDLPHVPRPYPCRQAEFPVYPFYLGDDIFCVFWCPVHSNSTRTSDMIHCFKFKIEMGFDFEYDSYRHATFLGCDRFAIKGVHQSLHNYEVLQRLSIEMGGSSSLGVI